MMRFTIFQDSRVGARQYQQDRIGYWQTRDALLMLVADGMGGHLRGDVAAQAAMQHLAQAFQREAKPGLADPQAFLFNAVGGAHHVIHQQARALGLPDTPRTTIVTCVVQGGLAWWSHVGDSRLYLVRRGAIRTRTRDHTRVQELVDAGRIREEAVSSHPERNKLLQCLGSHAPPRIEPAACARLAKDDVILLCSDGLWGPLTQRQLLSHLMSKPLGVAVPELMSLAQARAGKQCDNLSVVAMAWGEEEITDAQAVAPDTVPFHDLPTEVQDFSPADVEFERLSDDDIERRIAEIKLALKRTTRR
jgi:serine/threonine protein phosphatase PrpC